MRKTYCGDITKLEPHQVAVCGTNTEGRHGMGFALWCKKNAGAIYGQAKGLMGQTYGIVTKDLSKGTHPSVPKEYIHKQIGDLYAVSVILKDREFLIPYKGHGVNLNNYSPEEMAEMFVSVEHEAYNVADAIGWRYPGVPPNIIFEESFYELMLKIKRERYPELLIDEE